MNPNDGLKPTWAIYPIPKPNPEPNPKLQPNPHPNPTPNPKPTPKQNGQQVGLLRRPLSPTFQPSRPTSASPGANQRVASRRPTTAPPGAARSPLFGWVVAPAGLGLGSLPALSPVPHC